MVIGKSWIIALVQKYPFLCIPCTMLLPAVMMEWVIMYSLSVPNASARLDFCCKLESETTGVLWGWGTSGSISDQCRQTCWSVMLPLHSEWMLDWRSFRQVALTVCLCGEKTLFALWMNFCQQQLNCLLVIGKKNLIGLMAIKVNKSSWTSDF